MRIQTMWFEHRNTYEVTIIALSDSVSLVGIATFRTLRGYGSIFVFIVALYLETMTLEEKQSMPDHLKQKCCS